MRRLIVLALVLCSVQALAFAKRLNPTTKAVAPGANNSFEVRDQSGTVTFTLQDGHVQWNPGPLPLCGPETEWVVKADVTTGASTGRRTKLCLCTSNGAAMATYAWQNLTTGTVGSATACLAE